MEIERVRKDKDFAAMENERDVLESMVPLMRRGCSWLCVPEKVTMPDEDPVAMDE